MHTDYLVDYIEPLNGDINAIVSNKPIDFIKTLPFTKIVAE